MAGLSYSLVCRASIGVDSDTLPTATWLAPDGTDLQAVPIRGTSVTYSQQGYVTIATLQFQPLAFHHGGVYECVASILDTQEATSTGRTRQKIPLTIQSKQIAVSGVTDSGQPIYTPCTVPPPSVMVMTDSMEPFYAGTALTLTCAMALSSVIDTSLLEVNASWSRLGQPVSTHEGSRVTETFLPLPGSNNSFLSLLQFYPLEYTGDSGIYSCFVSVTPDTADSQYIQEVLVNQSITVTVLGQRRD